MNKLPPGISTTDFVEPAASLTLLIFCKLLSVSDSLQGPELACATLPGCYEDSSVPSHGPPAMPGYEALSVPGHGVLSVPGHGAPAVPGLRALIEPGATFRLYLLCSLTAMCQVMGSNAPPRAPPLTMQFPFLERSDPRAVSSSCLLLATALQP